MKLKTTVLSVAVTCAAMMSPSAFAYFQQDGWTLNDGTTETTDIGHLSLSGGVAYVNQQVDGSGNPFAGATFYEYGQIFNLSYVPENVQGFNDFLIGIPPAYSALKVEFIGLAGTVTAYDSTTGKINYSFLPNVGSIVISSGDGLTTLATLTNIGPSGGDLNDFFGEAQTAGQSTLFLNFLTFLNGFDIGLSDPYGLGIPTTYSTPEDLFLQVQTNNKIGAPASDVAACGFDETLSCRTIMVTSDGSADLLRIPEPGSLALMGLGLFGLGAIRRRKMQ